MRSFIGINFSCDVKEDISKIQGHIRSNALKGRFKQVDNFHITLKFLGEIEKNQADEIAKKLESIARLHSSFELRLQEIGRFKGRDNIRTLYIGLGGNIEALKQLNQATEAAMELLGFKKEGRPYTPHITISQDLILDIPFEELKKEIEMSSTHRIAVNKIELIKSEQIQNKRIYTPICGYELKPQQVVIG
ncbi:MAG: 2'-5' RNA ligase [Clostridiales bacterium GWB2_37_7]|nr:MAG: 2'-5' RNA ligase [Clostridiales bacterium GWB2_37_7]